MSRFGNSNYYQVSGWMVNELHLKGVQLQIYAIIYGFCQDGESEFTGSINYLCAWTSSAKNTVMKALKELTEGKYISKKTEVRNGVTFNSYKVNFELINNCTGGAKTAPGSSKTAPVVVQNLNGEGSAKTAPNNNISFDNSSDNTKNKKSGKAKKQPEQIHIDIINYLNEKAGKRFSPYTESTIEIINSRLNDNRTMEDFKYVIDVKVNHWLGTDFANNLCPDTLFAAKNFEKYMNQVPRTGKGATYGRQNNTFVDNSSTGGVQAPSY